jgi:hypothetical protein
MPWLRKSGKATEAIHGLTKQCGEIKMKKIIFAFLLISLGCATTTYKVKRPKQEYFNITITPLKTTLTVDDDIPVAVNIKNISTHTIFLPGRLDAVFSAIDENNKPQVCYYDLRYLCSIALYYAGPLPSGHWNVALERVCLCPQAEIIDTISLKSYKQLKPGKYRFSLYLDYLFYRQEGHLRSISKEFINIVDK